MRTYMLLIFLFFTGNCDNPPSPISLKLITPTHGKEILPEWKMPFFWNGKCKDYQFTVAKDKVFIQIEKDSTVTGTGINYQPKELYRDYYWRIRCGNEVREATFKVPKGEIKLIIPQNNTKQNFADNFNTQNFKWNSRCAQEDATISRDSTFRDSTQLYQRFRPTAFQPISSKWMWLLTGTTYFWKVECPLYKSEIRSIKTAAFEGKIIGKNQDGNPDSVIVFNDGNGKIRLSKFPEDILYQQNLASGCPSPNTLCEGEFSSPRLNFTSKNYIADITLTVYKYEERYWVSTRALLFHPRERSVWAFEGEYFPKD